MPSLVKQTVLYQEVITVHYQDVIWCHITLYQERAWSEWRIHMCSVSDLEGAFYTTRWGHISFHLNVVTAVMAHAPKNVSQEESKQWSFILTFYSLINTSSVFSSRSEIEHYLASSLVIYIVISFLLRWRPWK